MAVRSISGGYFLASIFSAHNLKRKERKWNKFLFVRDKPGSGWMSDVRTFACFLFLFFFCRGRGRVGWGVACRNSLTRDQTLATAMTQATTVIMPDSEATQPPKESYLLTFAQVILLHYRLSFWFCKERGFFLKTQNSRAQGFSLASPGIGQIHFLSCPQRP